MARQRNAVVLLGTLLGAVLALGAAGPAHAALKPGETRGADVVKVGWWWVANQPPAETGVAAYPQQSPPNVPAGHLPVAASAGDPDKVSALELRLDAKPGMIVGSATVVLQESTATGANVNADGAKIIACPVTEAFWADGTAARWDAKPTYDCDTAQAAGERDKDGRWTFDLAALASTWLGSGSGATPSFALVEGAEAPESFQVTFAGPADKGIGLDVTYLPAPETGMAALGAGPVASGGAPGAGAFGPSGAGATDAGMTSGSVAPGGAPPVDAAPTGEGTAETTPVEQAETLPVAAPATVQPWYSGLPKASFLLVPFALGLAFLAMLALGPDAQPSVGTSRHGVSRALERLRQAGSQAVEGIRR